MNVVKLAYALVPAALIAGPQAALGCGEMMFNAGKGLPFQSYLAPRPADVLILYTDARQDRQYAALEQAGHRLTLVGSTEALENELARNRYDVVIGAFDALDSMPTPTAVAGGSVHILPIVARSMRKSTQVLDRFDQFLLDSGSAQQYLSVINRVLAR